MALVEPPRSAHRDPRAAALVQRELGGVDRPQLQRRVQHVGRDAGVREVATGAARPARGPASVRSTSTQPVNRFSRFHVLWPWRSSTSVYGTVALSVVGPRVARLILPAAPSPGRSVPRMPDLHVVTLCTGNAARSVMAGAILREHVPGLVVTTSGTHVIEGMPMSWRTRDAIASLDIPVPDHRSRQATVAGARPRRPRDRARARARRVDAAGAPAGGAAHRDAEAAGARPGRTDRARCADRLEPMRLHEVELEPWEDVVDPGRRRPRRVRRVRARDRRSPARADPATLRGSRRCRSTLARSSRPATPRSCCRRCRTAWSATPSVLPALADAAAAVDLVAHCAQLARAARAAGVTGRPLHRRDARRRQGRQPQRPAVPGREERAGEAVAGERRGAGARARSVSTPPTSCSPATTGSAR